MRFVLFVCGIGFMINALFANNADAPHLLTCGVVCLIGFIIICEINKNK